MDEDKNTNKNSAEEIERELKELSELEEEVSKKELEIQKKISASNKPKKETRVNRSGIFKLMFSDRKEDKKENVPKKPQEEENKKIIGIEIPDRTIETTKTFEKDTKNVFNKKQTTLTKIAIEEKEREKKKGYKNPYYSETHTSVAENKSTLKIIPIISGLLIIVSLSIFGYFILNQKNTLPEKEIKPEEIDSPDVQTQTVEIQNTSKNELERVILEVKNNLRSQESVYLIEIRKQGSQKNITIQEFLEQIQVNYLANLGRAFEENFLIGTYGDEMFMIIKIKSFESAFAGMLNWENSIVEDLRIFLTQEGANGLFRDTIIRNIDTRISPTNDLGEKVIYAFPNKRFLVITSGEKSFGKVIKNFF